VDLIVEEPLGGAHRNVEKMMSRLKTILLDELRGLKSLQPNELLERRYNKFMAMGSLS
jgi:acetyl-CoA carboxylase carboxyl transferase subunit alpha